MLKMRPFLLTCDSFIQSVPCFALENRKKIKEDRADRRIIMVTGCSWWPKKDINFGPIGSFRMAGHFSFPQMS